MIDRRSAPGLALAGLLAAAFAVTLSSACTTILYTGPPEGDPVTLIVKNQDWGGDFNLQLDLVVVPRGGKAETTYVASNRSYTYDVKYGSVLYLIGGTYVTEGVNEKGLAVHLNDLVKTEFTNDDPEEIKAASEKPIVLATTLAAVIVQQFATVKEAVDAIRAEGYTVLDVPLMVPNDRPEVSDQEWIIQRPRNTNHLHIVDASGDAAIVEFIEGKPVIYHDRNATVMTNDPTYDKLLPFWKHWEDIGGHFLPGQTYSQDRFVRAHNWLKESKRTSNTDRAIAQVLSYAGNAADPVDVIPAPHMLNSAAQTQYASLHDLINQKSYFSSHIQPFRVHYWIDYSDGKVFEEGSGLKGIPNIHCYLDTDKECGPDTQLLGDITSKLAPYKVPDGLLNSVQQTLALNNIA